VFHASNNILKGRALAAYERAMSDLESMSDDTWPTLLQHVLEYVTLLTNLEGSALSAPTLTRKEIIERDTTRKESRAAAIAAAADADGGDGCGDGGGGDAASGQGDEDEGSRGQPAGRAAAKAAGGASKGKAPRRGERRSEPFVGSFIPWHNCHGGAWNETL
jgi:hypothetical protein